MIKILAPGWEKTFARRVQTVMNSFIRTIQASLRTTHQDVEARMRNTGAGTAGISMLQQQVEVYDRILKDLATSTKEMVNTRQKDLNREFVPIVARDMLEAYVRCQEENGT